MKDLRGEAAGKCTSTSKSKFEFEFSLRVRVCRSILVSGVLFLFSCGVVHYTASSCVRYSYSIILLA